MFEFFWVRAASVWVAALYIAMGVLIFAFPAASSTFFVWALAGGAAAYGVSHLVRYLQERKAAGKGNPGDLFLTVLPAAFSVFALIWPQAILSVLPLVLGSLLLAIGYSVVMGWVFAYTKMAITGELTAMGTDMDVIGGTFGAMAPEAQSLPEALQMTFATGGANNFWIIVGIVVSLVLYVILAATLPKKEA